MATLLKQSTAETIEFGPFLDSTDGNTEEAALSLVAADILVSKNHAALTAKNDATNPTGGTNAHYQVTLDATDTGTLGRLRVYCHKAGALPVWEDFEVVPANVYDSWIAGSDKLQVDAVEISNDSTAADNLESACDNYSATRGLAGTALPAAAADAAGGVPISDAGGLDLDSRMPASGAVTNLNTLYDGVEGFAPAYIGPRGLGVYLNDAAANTNTANGVDGTWNNPVSTIASAKTIADSLSLDRIYLINDTVVTLAATMEDYEFVGIGEMAANTINLGSQDVDNSHFENVLISGAQGGTGRIQAKECVLSAITGMEITALECLFASGTLTLRNDCAFHDCWSAVAGGGTPILDINSVANVNVYCRHYSGGLQINNAVATTIMSYEADGQLVIGATCTSLTVHVRGNCTIADNGTTTSLTQSAAINQANINAEVADVLKTDTVAQLAQQAPPGAPTFEEAIMYLYQYFRNKREQTATEIKLYDDAGTTVIAKSAVSDDGTTFTKAEFATGP